MFIDLDGFKEVNDAHGHQAGDELLQALSNSISGCIRASDTFARLGGDEFTIILSPMENMDACSFVAEKILKRINQPFALSVGSVRVSGSIGVAIYPQDGNTHDKLISAADGAMYDAKAKGKNCWVYVKHQTGPV